MDSIAGIVLLIIGAISAVAGVLVGSVLINGYVLSILWVWFLVPLGLPAISIAHSIGIAMIASWLTYQDDASKQDEKGSGLRLFLLLIVRPLLTLGIGYVAKQFI